MHYPENPKNLPLDFTKVQNSYIKKVVLAILGLVLFVVLYFAMVIGFGYLTYWQYEEFRKPSGGYLNLAAMVGSAMLFLFTLKFIFRWNKNNDKLSLVVTEKEQPDLYKFIHRIADDAKAPKPKKIILDHDVNASVSFNSTFLSLFIPGRKNLRIGLALVNGLNLSEFKAVMAHEFGHFSQSSMRVGSYVYMTNYIIHNMIFERDYWDRALELWRSIDLRLSFMAWIITPFVWMIRQLLFLLYKLLNILHASLSREMEFHADKVAVSLTGSEAIIKALWKLEKTFEVWNNTLNYTGTASQQKIQTTNLFQHQRELWEEGKEKRTIEIEDRRKDGQKRDLIFEKEETYSSLNMYASHPSNKDREENAKTPYIDAVEDTSSPWSLFTNPLEIQERLTENLYLHAMGLKKEELKPSLEAMQAFIQEERDTEQIFGERYLGNFQERYFTIPSANQLVVENSFLEANKEEVVMNFDALVKKDLVKLMAPVKEMNTQYKNLIAISNGTNKAKVFEYKGTVYKKKNLQFASTRIEKERMDYFESAFKDWDDQLFKLSYAATDEENRKEFLNRLSFLKIMQVNLRSYVNRNSEIITGYNDLSSKGEVTENELFSYLSIVNAIQEVHTSAQEQLKDCAFVPLRNIATKEELMEIIGEDKRPKLLSKKSFENGDFHTLLTDVESLIFQHNRIVFKLTSDILKPIEALTTA